MVKPKKHLGQHFLTDQQIARDIVAALAKTEKPRQVLEVGPGTGVLTQYLLQREDVNLLVAEIDTESVVYLSQHFPQLEGRILATDFLKEDLQKHFPGEFAIIGNFPYNISSQIFFKVLEYRQQVTEVVGMLQKEVADRIAAPPGSKVYGILSVLLQAYYQIEYCFTVEAHVFNPPPKVRSGVIRLVRNNVQQLACDEKLFVKVVKQAFSTRRKTLRNALKPFALPAEVQQQAIFDKRAEQLGVQDFIMLTNWVTENRAG